MYKYVYRQTNIICICSVPYHRTFGFIITHLVILKTNKRLDRTQKKTKPWLRLILKISLGKFFCKNDVLFLYFHFSIFYKYCYNFNYNNFPNMLVKEFFCKNVPRHFYCND